ncbi:GIY-YIG nuclease family protein [Fluoribacter gormanii]|uniref:GIY-YIG nuclease family protein n=1 Tax=Fluoribacter gormanii TaxID=464 RepID=UPI0022435D80|nr:GIY-YIG nuclease family protein [Fluoribacter gormanii]MCW8470650.1 GIY-YIG nuclease family protein [Fluoribacter gormanii]
MSDSFFPPKSVAKPEIYAYVDTNPQYDGLLKIGYTCIGAEQRVRQQYPILRPGPPPYKIELVESAMRKDGSAFTDHAIHRHLRNKGFHNLDGEWFKCSVADVKAAIIAVRDGIENEDNRTLDFTMRPEQEAAVNKTIAYFNSFKKENPEKTPHFLWNAKMRFGKTFATYQLAKRMGWKQILILTFKPAVHNAWRDDLQSHIDFKEWLFISRDNLSVESNDPNRPIVCFGSFQDYMGKNNVGGIKAKNEWVHNMHWDCVIFDEYHYGAWRESAKELFAAEDKKEAQYAEGDGIDFFDENTMPITTSAYLYLSGTPFRAIATGEFIEEQIYNWTYSDEQRAKEQWKGDNNPYDSLPRMVMLTYQLPDSIRDIAMGGEFNQFDLNTFFSATGEGLAAKFKYENEVQKWLDLIRGAFLETTVDNLKLGAEKPPMPFSDVRLLALLSHTFWFLPSVASCYAMKNLLGQRHNKFYQAYKILVAAGSKAGIGVEALPPIENAMETPIETRTITLSCGKLTTGVSVKPWTGIFMLRNCSSPETYFQAAFRVQTPWVINNPDNKSPNKQEIIKRECYVFDFAPDRALRQIADYSCRLNVNESSPEKNVAEFIHFLPVLAYDGSSMKQINAAGILDMAMSGTTATLLARRWESALLVNVDNYTLERLMNSQEAMEALMRIEGFRTLNQDIETIINKSEAVQKIKKEASERELNAGEKRELVSNEKEYKKLRNQIREKLIKFATRIPVFMYLTDYREKGLKDVITQLEPGLFKKVTGLIVKDFELLVSLGVFNSALMNDAVYKFKRYEDASLIYTGINRHENESVGLYETVITAEEYCDGLSK